MDLRHSLVPDEVIEQLKETMPRHEEGSGGEAGADEGDRAMPRYDYVEFMKKFTGGGAATEDGPAVNGTNGH
jgi:hypothetical protein